MDETIKIQEKKALYWLSRIPGLGMKEIRKIWEQYHSFVIKQRIYKDFKGFKVEFMTLL